MGNLDAGIDPGNITKLGLSWYASVQQNDVKKKKSEKEKEKSARSFIAG